MRKIIVLAAIILATLVGCATDATVHSSASELPGTYYSGDGLGRNVTVILSPDGTYSSDWQGCLGVYGESNGTWLVQGEHIVFTPLNEKDQLAGYLTRATTIQHAGRLGFARDQDLKHDRVSEQLIFLQEVPRP
jgi:hypothetical protein